MKRIISALSVLACAATFALVGCSGDDDDDSGGTAGKGNEPTAGAPNEGNNLTCDPEAATTCQNETDCSFVVDGTARTTAQACGKGECLSSEDENCARDCILADLGMTSDCATCYADFVACTIKECLGQCLADPNATTCTDCQVDKGCRGAFDTCSGLPE